MRVEMMGLPYQVTPQMYQHRLGDCLKRKTDSIATTRTTAVWTKDHHSKVAIETIGNKMNIGLRLCDLAIPLPFFTPASPA